MYLYFDNNGILKEIVDDVATRKGNNEVNKIYIYVDGLTPKTEWITYQTSDGKQSNETLIETTITKTIPYDRNRDLTYFKNFQEYLFYVATIPSSVLTVSGLTKASVRVALQDDSLMTLGLIIFTIEESVVLQDSFITESQYQYLLNIISNFEELNNTGVIGISTQIINGAFAPYDQGRIVLSTYNDNFTIATVVKNSAGKNVYSVLDMTFVKQVPFNSSNPNLEGLEINGKKYKVAYSTSQLNNDAGFITNKVSSLINYYTKTIVDEKFANIDLSDYYTKTESDGRYVLTTNFSWNNLANKPTSLSDFINDEGFITNTVSNLSNYYDKSSIDNIVATLKTGAFQVVNELPSTGAEGVVYLVGTQAPYTMYIWENNAFLNIGTTEVNLDGYVKGTNLNTNYVILGNGGSNVVASTYTINNQNANNPNSLLTANVINTLLGTKQDVLTQGQGINISNNEISTPVSTTSTIITQQSVNKLRYDGKPILVDYAISDDSGNIIANTYATFNDLHTFDIGDITSSSNIYQTLYQNVYENDATKKNVVIFSTEGFVDSATSLISSGEHIATPYQDNKILIDSVFVLNSDNSATTIISSDTFIIDIGTITNINTHTPAYTLSSDEKSAIESAYNNGKIVYLKFNYTNEGNTTETIILPIESKVAQIGGGYFYYGGGTLANHEVWSFNISFTSLFVNNITNTHRTKLFELGTLSQLTGTLSNATEIGNAFNNGYTPIIKFAYDGTTYYFAEPSGTYNSSSNTGSLKWISVLSDKTIEKFILNFPAGTYTLSNEESDTVIIDLGELSESGTLSSQILTQINNNYGSKSITFIVTMNGFSITASNYFVSENYLSLSILIAGEIIEVDIDLADGNYLRYGTSLLISANVKTINNISLEGAGNIAVQEPLVSGTNIKTINGNSILGSGDLTISGGGNTDVIGFIECSPNSTLTDDKLQKLLSKKYGLYIISDMFFPTSQDKIFSSVPFIKYLQSSIQLVYKLVTINQGNSLNPVSTFTIDLTTKNATDNEVNNLFTNPGQPIPERAITLANLNAFKQQIENEINNEIGNVLQEGF